MNDTQLNTLMEAFDRLSVSLERLAYTYEDSTRVSRSTPVAETLSTLEFFQQKPQVGDIIECTVGCEPYFFKGARGRIIQDVGLDWYVEFRCQGNGLNMYRDGGADEGACWYVNKGGCKLVSNP